MKAIVTILGVILLVVAAVYFLVPADSLPSFFPGHEAGLMRIRAKHGMLVGGLGVILLGAAGFSGEGEGVAGSRSCPRRRASRI
jgi:hypothetical protein